MAGRRPWGNSETGRGGHDSVSCAVVDITVSNADIPSAWKRATVFPIYKGGNRSVGTNYRPVSLTLLVCKQMEYVIAGYLRQVWDTNLIEMTNKMQLCSTIYYSIVP